MTPTRADPSPPPRNGTAPEVEGARPLAASAPRVLLVDADSALVELLREWLEEQGCRVVAEPGEAPGASGACHAADAANAASTPGSFDLVIVDLAYPRQGGAQRVQRIAQAHPGAPILALSTMFFACVDCHGPVARALGVGCVLPKPATREALNKAVRRLLSR